MPDSKQKYLYHSSYLAPVEFYSLLASEKEIYLDKNEFFEKSTYRNRCRIMSANGVLDLIIPVVKGASLRMKMKDVKISAHDNWQQKHWRALNAAYSSSPFFEYYADDFEAVYKKNWEYLWDFNEELQNVVLELIDLEKYPILLPKEQSFNEIFDIRNKIVPQNNSNFNNFTSYFQVFESKFGFTPGLSIVDLLFNMGTESILLLRKEPKFV